MEVTSHSEVSTFHERERNLLVLIPIKIYQNESIMKRFLVLEKYLSMNVTLKLGVC